MTLLEQITEDYKQAMKNHEEVKKLALNYLLAQIKNKRIVTACLLFNTPSIISVIAAKQKIPDNK